MEALDKLALRAIITIFGTCNWNYDTLILPKHFERVIVYSSIFWALTLKILKKNPQKVRLIVRDIFPLWLLTAGILKIFTSICIFKYDREIAI